MDSVQHLLCFYCGDSHASSVCPAYERVGRVTQFGNTDLRGVHGHAVVRSFLVFFQDGLLYGAKGRLNALIDDGGVPRFVFAGAIVAFLDRLIAQICLGQRIRLNVGGLCRWEGLVSRAYVINFSCRIFLVFSSRVQRHRSFIYAVNRCELATFCYQRFPALTCVNGNVVRVFR